MTIDRLYVITTNPDTPRFQKFLRETIDKLPDIPYEIVDAVTPETLTYDVEKQAQLFDADPDAYASFDRISLNRRGQDLRHVQLECSCSGSHAKVLKLAINRNEIALILEDDALCIDTDFSHLNDLPEDWDIFYVTHGFYANRSIINNDLKARISHEKGLIYRLRGTALTTTGYIVNGKRYSQGLKALRYRWMTGSVPDLSISYCAKHSGLNVYLSSKRNFWHDDAVFQSTLTTPQTEAFKDKYLDILRIGQTFDIERLTKITSYIEDSIVLYLHDGSNRDMLETLFQQYQYDLRLFRVLDGPSMSNLTETKIKQKMIGHAYNLSSKDRYVSQVVYSKDLQITFYSWDHLHEQYVKLLNEN